jgi:N,N'-diacetylbacillosaminyl-diphospho-undecaprenol alpha-1,3-N-acetylgalactosaminyltransferase
MKIAFLSHFDLNLFLFRLPIMKELVKKGNVVYAVCPKGEVFDKFKEFGIKAVEYKIDRGSLNIFKEINTIKNIKEVINKIDPDILHTFMHKPNIYGNLIFHKNTINTVTGLGSFFIHNDFKSKIVKKIIELGYKITTKNTKRVIFQNSDDLNYFVNKNIIVKEKVVLIKSSGIDINKWKNENINFKKETLGIFDDKPIVLMIARVIKDKGVKEYIKAAESLKDKAHFLYVGDIDKGNKNAFMPDWKNVKYLGFRRDIKELISICDIFILPSYREGVPRTLLEAASMSKPIITTDAPGCREVVEDNKNGFLVPIKDYKTLVQKLEILIDNPDLREKFGENSRIKAEKEFDIKIIVDKYLKIYEEILSV